MGEQSDTALALKRAALLVVGLGAVLLVLNLTGNMERAPAAPTPTDVPRVPRVGQTGHLVNPTGNVVAIAPTADDLSEAIQAMSSGDSTGLVELSRRGQLRQAVSGTSVLVIDGAARFGIGVSRVRILDGTYAGQAWWVIDNSLRP